MKRVLLIVVDGCTPRVLGPAIDRAELPVLADLAARGSLRLDCISIFPSITPAATASIVTGQYPSQHGIAGMSWWNPSTGEVSYFGDDVWTVLQRGIGEFLRGFLVQLNGERLEAPTLFEIVERGGRRAACFNHLIFRGDVRHEVSPPLLLRILPSVSASLHVHGPSWLCLGDFVSSAGPHHEVDNSGGVFSRFGLDDQGTTEFLMDLPGAGALPDFSVAYFADYDFESHEHGPADALETLRHLDGRLHAVFEHWGGVDRVLDETCIVLTADHSHSNVGGDESAAIDLDDVLGGYRLADPAVGWHESSDLLVCPNMRSAEVYLRRDHPETVRGVCGALLEDARIDQVIWRESPGDVDQFHVATRDRGALRFRRADEAAGRTRDEYGGRWAIHGDAAAVDASIDNGRIAYGAYPNALERIANGVDHPRKGRLWVTARPGYEFQAQGQRVHHDAGSHGTLHELDSLVPLLVVGQPPQLRWSQTPRTIDVAPLCAELLGLPCDMGRPGDSRG